MNTSNTLNLARDRRRLVRVPINRPVRFELSSRFQGVATSLDVGRGGMCLWLPQLVEPGSQAMLRLDGLHGEPVELKARVAWQLADAMGIGCRAGLQAFLDEPEASVALGELMVAALSESGSLPGHERCSLSGSSDETEIYPVDPPRAAALPPAAGLSQTCWRGLCPTMIVSAAGVVA